MAFVRWPAPAVAVSLWGLLLVTAGALGYRASTGSDQSKTFVRDVPWTVWCVVAALAVVIFVLLFLYALGLIRHTGDWGVSASRGRRWGYLGLATIIIAVAMAAQIKIGRSPDLPVSRLELRTRAVLFTGFTAAIPWLTLVWLTQEECQAPRSASPATELHPPLEPPDTTLTLNRLLQLWRLLVSCVGAFALGVVAAIATAGALRAAFVSVHPNCAEAFPPPSVVPAGQICAESFPPSNVLYYGAFFAVLLMVVAAPLGASWRARAHELVDRTYPLPADGKPTETWEADRARLIKVLHLDTPILRNPLIALSVFTPLIASTLAAFIPQLGNA